jgi:hypothetical protein
MLLIYARGTGPYSNAATQLDWLVGANMQIERISPEFDIAHNLGHIDPEKFPMT